MAEGYPYWSEDELDQLVAAAREAHIERFSEAMRSAYRQIQAECKATVGRLLRDTDWLWQLERDPDCFERMPREYLDAARYLTSPVISDDTLKLLVEGREDVRILVEL